MSASAHRKIVASRDIFDEHGTKLWAKGNVVTASLKERLSDRKLRQPLETCLTLEGGVNARELKAAMSTFFDSGHALAQAVLPYASKLVDEVAALPVQSIAQLLLTTNQVTRPTAFEHACQAMALAGAMALRAGAGRMELRMALLGGLMHDLGELYVDPKYFSSTGALNTAEYRHLALHPTLGQALLMRFGAADYPAALAQAIGEHHERLDGSGYPARLKGPQISKLGRLLAVVECAMGVMQTERAPLASASFARRFVAGEFDAEHVGFLSEAAREADEALGGNADHDEAALANVAQRIDLALVQARQLSQASALPGTKAVAERAAGRLTALRRSWNSLGLWANPDAAGAPPQAQFEIALAAREFNHRLSTLKRECLWAEKAWSESSEAQLAPLWSAVGAPAPERA